MPSEWLGNCVTEASLEALEEQEPECETQDDCDLDEDEVCEDGECVEIDIDDLSSGD